ncbi:MAG: hypothetical protein SFY80_02630 [Verrucomicrobiota bacterium]|nr:hypothetical protein [Verrucomicrobiota bacterium]
MHTSSYFSALGILLCAIQTVGADIPFYEYNVPPTRPMAATALGTIGFGPINECSGIVQSRQFPGVFWVHNDSGDWPRIFAIRQDGTIIKPTDEKNYRGVVVEGASNRDWEDIATDAEGNLIIADIGNNQNSRRDLTLYTIKEPDPTKVTSASVTRSIRVYYPEQKEFPPKKNNFDCEAMFTARGAIYLITKHRADANAVLYRVPMTVAETAAPVALERLSAFVSNEMVTGADCSPDGRRLIVLTYDGVWGFECKGEQGEWFAGQARFYPVRKLQGEAICWDGPERIIMTNEKRDIVMLKWSEIPVVSVKGVDRIP